MKIKSNTSDQLILEYRPWIFGGVSVVGILGLSWFAMTRLAEGQISDFLGALVGIGLLALCFWAFVRRIFVVFDRNAGTVTLREASVTNATETTHPLARIDHSFVEVHEGIKVTRKAGPTYRAVLRLKPGVDPQEVPLIPHFSSGKGAERIAAAVNDWLTPKA